MEENIVNQTEHTFTSGKIFPELTKFMVPILGALILQALYGAVDVLVVGRFGTTPGLSGVSTGSNIINLITFTVTSLSMGITVLIGQYIGNKQTNRIGNLIGGSIIFFIVFSIVVAIIILIFAPQLALLMQAPEEALEQTVIYERICGGGIIFIVFYNLISSIFRGLGNSQLPLLFVSIACIVNIIGDLVFVAIFKMDAAGAALATVIAQAVSVILSLVVITKIELPFTFGLKNIRLNKEVNLFIKIGFPIALQELLTQLSFLTLNAFINRLGLIASSGYGVANKLIAFILLLPSALQQSLSAFTAQNFGAHIEERARKALYIGIGSTIWIGAVITVFIYFKGDVLARIFTTDPEVIQQAAEYLKGFSLEPIVTTILFSFIGYYNGHAQTVFVMLQGLTQTFLIRLPVSYIMSIQVNASLAKIGFAAPSATIFAIVLNILYYIYYTKKLKKEGLLEA